MTSRYTKPDQINNITGYHPPTTPVVAEAHDSIRDVTNATMHHYNELLPESPEKTTALNKLREAMMWANASIACIGNENPIWQQDTQQIMTGRVAAHRTTESMIRLADFMETHYQIKVEQGSEPFDAAIRLLSSNTPEHRAACAPDMPLPHRNPPQD